MSSNARMVLGLTCNYLAYMQQHVMPQVASMLCRGAQ